jgi:hypothetical protein
MIAPIMACEELFRNPIIRVRRTWMIAAVGRATIRGRSAPANTRELWRAMGRG